MIYIVLLLMINLNLLLMIIGYI